MYSINKQITLRYSELLEEKTGEDVSYIDVKITFQEHYANKIQFQKQICRIRSLLVSNLKKFFKRKFFHSALLKRESSCYLKIFVRGIIIIFFFFLYEMMSTEGPVADHCAWKNYQDDNSYVFIGFWVLIQVALKRLL